MSQSIPAVLLVDDDIDTQRLFRATLKRSRLTLTCAEDYAVAQQLLGEQTFDVIVVDIMLPDGQDGYRLLKLIREEYHLTCPVIAITAYYNHDSQNLFQQAGFSAFLPKPLPVENLVPYLEHFLSPE